MQFSLRTVFAAIAGFSLFCGICFAAPIRLTLVLLYFLVLVSPSLWVVGAVHGSRKWRPFFLGGVMAGIVPFIMLTIAFTMALTSYSFSADSEVFNEYGGQTLFRLGLALAFVFPGFCSCVGGTLGMYVARAGKEE